MNAEQWLQKFADATGTSAPSAAEVETLLELAGVAAHASERKAAPIACWLVGRLNMDSVEALKLAQQLSGDE